MATAQEFIKTAEAELGNGSGKYNTGGQPWCAIFVNWCLRKIGYGKQGTAAASSFASFGKNHKAGDGYAPKPGDLLLVNYTGSWADHVAIVESYSNGTISSLNGNGGSRPGSVTRSPRSYGRNITVIEMQWDGGKGGKASYIKYELTREQKISLAKYVNKEAGSNVDGKKAVASHMCNMCEYWKWSNDSRYKGSLYATIHGLTWYAASTRSNNEYNSDDLNAVEECICNGNRNIPPYVTEFDMWGGVAHIGNRKYTDIISVSPAPASDSDLNQHTSVLKNAMGASGKFWATYMYTSYGGNIFYYESDKYKEYCEKTYSCGSGDDSKETYFTDTNEIIPLHPTLFRQDEMIVTGDLNVFVGNHDVTSAIGELSWSNSLMELATTMDVEMAKSDTKFTYLYEPGIGDIVRIYTGNEIFRGVIISSSPGGKHSGKYTIADAGWYMAHTSDTYQFNSIPANTAIQKICGDLSVPIAYIDNDTLSAVFVTGVYIDKSAAEIIADILSIAGGKWNMDFSPGGLRIYKIGTFTANPQFRTSENTMPRSSVKYRGNESITQSIEDRKTAVKVISEQRVLTAAVASDSYNKYGFLQATVQIDPEKENAESVRDAKLAELNVDKNTRSFDMVVELSDYTRAGDVIDIDGTQYAIANAAHSIKKKRHTVSVEVERIEII